MNQAVNAAFRNAAFVAQWKSLGAEPGGGTQEELGKLVSAEVDRWALVAKAANIRVE
jgi:tripartite-type tricarboxylate transporter receptor subunit TctC